MAKKATANKSKEALKVEWGGFVDIRLDDTEKDTFHHWHSELGEGVWSELAETVAQGFKLGLSYDPDGDFYLATLTAAGVDVIGLQDRYCLTARAPEWGMAVALLLFKHIVIARRNWGAYKPRTGRMENFG